MPILTDISILYTCPLDGTQDHVSPIEDAAIAWSDGIITWVGPKEEMPAELSEGLAHSANGNVVIPGLIDCHTHLCFGGWRADEFEMRIKGQSYLEIARAGGGIRKTMRQTREATDEVLIEHGLGSLAGMASLGVTTVECKSGYGLSLEAELRQLRIYKQLLSLQPLELVSTFLGGHIVPPEYENDRDGYINLLCNELIPAVAEEGLAEFCDVFVEESAFVQVEAERILKTGQAFGLRSKLHVDQLSDGDGAALAARMDAMSADHLEYTTSAGMEAMAQAEVVGVCLPLATLYLGQQPMNARAFVQSGVCVAVATDFNPGSAPSYDLPLAMMLSCTLNQLTPAEALKGATIHAAKAIGREHLIGSIEVGKQADLALLNVLDVNDWMYHFRPNACTGTYIRGVSQN